MPLKNYIDLDPEFLAAYWNKNKDVLGVTHFGDLIPEVLWLDKAYESKLLELINLRISYKLGKYENKEKQSDAKQRILLIKETLRTQIEKELSSRLIALRRYLRSPARDPHLSMQEIYRHKAVSTGKLADTLMGFVKQFKKRRAKNKQF